MNSQFTWKHEDRSIIEFSEHGWKSDDAEKATWLTQMSDLCSSSPTVPPGNACLVTEILSADRR
jgi:hypothetical protein